MYTQYICTTEGHCLCSDNGEDDVECCCIRQEGAEACMYCLAPMKLIDFETGEAPVN